MTDLNGSIRYCTHRKSFALQLFCRVRIVFFLTILFSLTACRDGSSGYIREQGHIFGTIYHLTYRSDTAYTRAVDSCFLAFSRSLNPFDSLSLISAINSNRSGLTDTLFRTCFRRAVQIGELSGGAYDVTCSPLVNAWGFGFKNSGTVTPEQIDSLLTFVGYRKVRLQGDTLLKDDPRMTLTFSSIAKGFSADCVAGVLRGHRIEDYLVEIGGEIAYAGRNPQGKAWRIGIDRPVDENDGIERSDFQFIIELPGKYGGLATSGNYRNYYIKDGRKYAHTIDPRTGYPTQTDVLSATVLARDCMTADALATAFMVVGSEKAKQLAAKFTEVSYLLVCGHDSGKTHTVMSPDFPALILKQE